MSSLGTVPPAKIGDKLVTTDLAKSGTSGFAFVAEPDVVVRPIPGTELVFDKAIRYYRRFSLFRFGVRYRIAKFRHFEECDALEFRDGRIVTVSELAAGQTATVSQVPPSASPP